MSTPLTSEKSPVPRMLRVRALLLSIVGLGLLVGLIWFANPARVWGALRGSEPAWIAVVLSCILVSTLLGAMNSYIMAAPGPAVRFSRFLPAYWVAWAFGQVVPGQIGDVLGMSLFLRKRGLTLPVAVGRLGVDKLISLFCTLLLAGGLILIYRESLPRLAGLLGMAAATIILMAYLTSRRWSRALSTKTGWRAHVANSLFEAHRVMATRPLAVMANVALTIAKLFIIGVCYWAMFRALHTLPGNLFDVAVTANSAGLVAYIPISANGVGTVEAGGLYLFGLHGIAAPIVIATYLALRFANLALAWIGAALVLLSGVWHRASLPR